MKILIINDLYFGRGAENHARLEKKILENAGHQVLYITIDPDLEQSDSQETGHLSFSYKSNKFEKLWYRFFMDDKVYKWIRHIIQTFAPDIVHLHNIYLSSRAVYLAVRDSKTFQTVHDYSIVCVKSTCIDHNSLVCGGVCEKKCWSCLKGSWKEKAVFIARWIALINNNRLKKLAINKFISPSKNLQRYCNRHGFETVCINNPIILDEMSYPENEHRNKGVFLYFGAVAVEKGIIQLLEVFSMSDIRNKYKLIIAGGIKDGMKKTIGKFENFENIEYVGEKTHEEVMKLLSSVDVVVVPSLWVENYPTTVLEAISRMKLVIASDRGGMKEMLDDDNMIFDVLNPESIQRAIKWSYELKDEEYRKIVQEKFERIRENNNGLIYAERLIKLFNNKNKIPLPKQ